MGGSNAVQFLVQIAPLAIVSAIMLPPYVMIFRRMERSPWWAALLFVPFGLFALPWIVAFKMPRQSERRIEHYENVFGGIEHQSIRRGGERD